MNIKAFYLSSNIKLKEIIRILPYNCIFNNKYQAIFKLDGDQYVIYYSFGVFTLINIDDIKILKFREYLNSQFDITDMTINDHYLIKVQKNKSILVTNDHVILPKKDLEYIKIISLVIAELVILDYYEEKIDKMLIQSISYAQNLENSGTYPTKAKELLKFIGLAINTRQYILSKLHIFDSPDEVWDDYDLENLFKKLQDEFDIKNRFKYINISLDSVQESIEIIVNLLQAKKSHHLEWLVIALIAFEIIITILEKAHIV